MDRILKGTSATISTTFYADGVATDPNPATATIEVLRDDGTSIVAAGTPAPRTGVGVFTFALTPIHTSLLDMLTARWTATLSGESQIYETQIEVVGGFFFTLADAKARTALSGVSNDLLRSGRTLAEEMLEDACGVAFVPRYGRETLDAGFIPRYGRELNRFRQLLYPSVRRLRAIRSIEVDGVAYAPEQLAALRVARGGIYNSAGWPDGYANIVVGYEHGLDFPPARVSNAAMLLLERWRASQPAGERVVAGSVDRVSFRLAVAGADGEPFDVPEANAVVRRHASQAVRLA